MEKKIVIFENPDFGQIRTTCDAQGEPLFCLPDVCKVLNLQASDVKRRLDDGVISTHTVKDSLGRKNLINFVNEDGLYDAILDSRKPEARAFRKWVTAEVLPQIRKTGGYIPLDKDDDEKTILCKAVGILKVTLPDYRFITLVGASTAMMTLLSDVQKKNGSKAPARLNGWSHRDGLSGSSNRKVERACFRFRTAEIAHTFA